MHWRAIVRIDPALIVCPALALGSAVCVAPVAGSLGAVATTVLLYRRVTLTTLLVAWVALGLGVGRARVAIARFETQRIQVRDAIHGPRRCAGIGAVRSSPTWSRGRAHVEFELSELDCEGSSLAHALRGTVHGGPADLRRGDVVALVADLAPIQLYRNLGLPDPTPLAARRGILLSGGAISMELRQRGRGFGAMMDAARAHTRARILQTFAPAAQPLARALVLGENDLDPEDDTAFKLSGLAHLLAVSGTHLVLAVVGVVKLLRALLVRSWLAQGHDVERWAAAFGGGLALGYADFAGGSGSAWRAAWMLFVVFGARALGRHAPVSRSFALSVAAGELADPLLSFDISFLLSAAATAGLVTTGPVAARACARISLGPVRFVLQTVATTLCAMLPCAPLLALLSPGLTLAGAFANVVAGPLGEMVALPLCLLHGLFGWSPAIERGMALVASGALLAVRQTAILGGRAHCLSFSVAPPGAWEFALLWVVSTGLLLFTRLRLASAVQRWIPVATGMVAAVIGLSLLQTTRLTAAQPRNLLRVTAVDVGQGDATLIDLPDGRMMLVDGGGSVGGPDPGKLVILPLLRQRGRRRVDIAVLTHAHPDHLQGLATVLNAVEVGELWVPWEPADYPPVPVLHSLFSLLADRRVPVHSARALCSAPRHLGGARAYVLSPCDPTAAATTENDGSLVLRITFGERAVLLPGDADAHREQDLITRRGQDLSADLLKVGHHGSRTSTTPAWLESVQPKWATIACGVRNPHGHPHAETVARLDRHGTRVFRLDRTGSTEWSTDGHAVSLRVFEGASH